MREPYPPAGIGRKICTASGGLSDAPTPNRRLFLRALAASGIALLNEHAPSAAQRTGANDRDTIRGRSAGQERVVEGVSRFRAIATA